MKRGEDKRSKLEERERNTEKREGDHVFFAQHTSAQRGTKVKGQRHCGSVLCLLLHWGHRVCGSFFCFHLRHEPKDTHSFFFNLICFESFSMCECFLAVDCDNSFSMD